MSNPFKPVFDLRAAWFVLFYAVLAVVFLLKSRYKIKKPFVASFFLLLCLTTVVGTQFLPFIAWNKFPNTYPQTETDYELRVVTEDGEELVYDTRATLGGTEVMDPYLTRDMAEEYSNCESIEAMEYLLRRARAYRNSVEHRSILAFTRFPPHGLDDWWTKKEIKQYAKFTGIRLYARKIVSSEDGTAIKSVSERMVTEYRESSEYECPEVTGIGG